MNLYEKFNNVLIKAKRDKVSMFRNGRFIQHNDYPFVFQDLDHSRKIAFAPFRDERVPFTRARESYKNMHRRWEKTIFGDAKHYYINNHDNILNETRFEETTSTPDYLASYPFSIDEIVSANDMYYEYRSYDEEIERLYHRVDYDEGKLITYLIRKG